MRTIKNIASLKFPLNTIKPRRGVRMVASLKFPLNTTNPRRGVRMVASLIILIFGFSVHLKSQESICFPEIKTKDSLVYISGTTPIGDIFIECPKTVAYNKKFHIKGYFAQNQNVYASGTYRITGGWVNINDEEVTSPNFWVTGKYENQLFTFYEQKRNFYCEYVLPDDEMAHNHKVFKIQVTVSGKEWGTGGIFTRTRIYWVPITNLIFGEVKNIDIPENSEKDEYSIQPLYSDNNNLIKCFYLDYNSNNTLITEEEAQPTQQGCYKHILTHIEDESYNAIFINNREEKTDKIVLKTTINNPVEGGKITTYDYSKIIEKINNARDSLDNKKVSISSLMDGSLTWEITKAVSILLNYYYQTNVDPDGYIYLKDMLEYRHFNPDKLNELLIKYADITKDYDTIGQYKGIDNDSLRAELLTRIYYGIIGVDSLFNATFAASSEASKVVLSYAKMLLLVDELKIAADELLLKNELTKKTLILSLAKALTSIIQSAIDIINTTTNNQLTDKQTNTSVSLSNKFLTGTIDAYLTSANNKISKEGKDDVFQSYKAIIKDDIFDIAASYVALRLVMPFYIAYSNSDFNALCEYLCLEERYYKASNNEKHKNSEAFSKTINTNTASSTLIDYNKDVERDVLSSAQMRASSDIVKNLFEATGSIYQIIAGKNIALSSVFKPIKIAVLTSALLMDWQLLNNGFDTRYLLPVKVFFPDVYYNSDLNYFYKNYGNPSKKLLASGKNFITKSKGSNDKFNNLYNKMNDIEKDIVDVLDSAFIVAEQNDSLPIMKLFYYLNDFMDSVININNTMNHIACSAIDTLKNKHQALYNSFMLQPDNNLACYTSILDFNQYLLRFINNKASLDTLVLYKNNITDNLTTSFNFNKSLLDTIHNLSLKPYIFIENPVFLPEVINSNESFKLKAKLINIGSTALDSIYVSVSADSSLISESPKEIFISRLEADGQKELEWDLICKANDKYIENYTIIARSKQNSYTYKGSFTFNSNPVSKYSVEGYVKYKDLKNLKLLSGIFVELKNKEGKSIDYKITDSKGYFKFTNLTSGDYSFVLSTDRNPGGFNPVDALIINKYYLGIYKFADQLLKLASDVNADNKITPIDALMINRRFLSILKSFKSGLWLFENKNFTIYNQNINLEIYGVCFGDVNGSFEP